MCGIFGYIGTRNNAATLVLDALKTLEYRGYDSWGVAVVTEGHGTSDKRQVVVKKRIGKIGNATVDDLPTSSFAFGHTRWATHGGVTEINAHPHLDCTGQIALIHNGIVENYEELKNKLVNLGHHFVSETDSEAIVHLVEEHAKTTDLPTAVRQTFNELSGLNAIIVMQSGTRSMIVARNGSPLVVGYGKDEQIVASDPSALLPYTREAYFLEDGEMAILDDHNITIARCSDGTAIAPKKQLLDQQATQSTLGDNPNFMIKEIYEQPELIDRIANKNRKEIENMAKIILAAHGTYLLGCGSASYACLAGTYLFSKIASHHVNWAVGSEFGYQLEFLNDKSLIVALSQSGETMDILESVKKSKSKGAKIMALVNTLGSSLYRQADYTMLIGAGQERAVASTKAVIGKLAHLTLLAYAAAGKSQVGQEVLRMAAQSARLVLSDKSRNHIANLAKQLAQTTEHIYVIGRGLSYPASLETAIKIKEISYIHAEGMAAGELKHGPLALVTNQTPCIAFLPNDETYGANLAGAMEMKARGGYIIGISHKPHEIFDYYLEVADAGEATIIPNIISGQLLAYYLTMEKGLDPDKPRNLAKSVTVK